MGLHPWFIKPETEENDFLAIENACKEKKIMAIGECGLDKLKAPPMARQIEIFNRHVALSETYKIPMIIHCVRAHDQVIAARQAQLASMPWILHGFAGSKELAKK
ncbi:MAG: hypothetical protein HC896_15845 [Bacteroidales bacterium]|nr:hypothetical protein [Bacteroidales bacterium]